MLKIDSSSTSPWIRALVEIRKNRLALFCAFVVIFLICVAIFAPWIAPHDPDVIDLVENRLRPPVFMKEGKWEFPLGTDNSGRDVLSRLIYGSRISMSLGLVPILIASFLGIPVGLIAGYMGKKFDEILMRTTDVLLAFPSILLALIVVAFLGQGILNVMIAVGISYAPSFARIVRSAVVTERNKEYVASARALGASHMRIMVRHIAPNITSSLIVVFTLTFASALLEAAGLSFLGLGVRPPSSEWGSMLADGKNYFYDGTWMIIFPGILIFAVVMSLNILGDCLRDAFDPRFKGK